MFSLEKRKRKFRVVRITFFDVILRKFVVYEMVLDSQTQQIVQQPNYIMTAVFYGSITLIILIAIYYGYFYCKKCLGETKWV